MAKQTKLRTISHNEQAADYGIIKRSAPNYLDLSVPSAQATPPPNRAEVVHTINATPVATQHVEVKTSQVDRGLGFLIASTPLFFLFGAATLAVCSFGAGVPIWSGAAIAIFLVSTLAAWLIGLAITVRNSPDGVALFEAGEKWFVVRREQTYRWRAWLLQMGYNPKDFDDD